MFTLLIRLEHFIYESFANTNINICRKTHLHCPINLHHFYYAPCQRYTNKFEFDRRRRCDVFSLWWFSIGANTGNHMILNSLDQSKTKTNLFYFILRWLRLRETKKFERFKINVAQRCDAVKFSGRVAGFIGLFLFVFFLRRVRNQTNIYWGTFSIVHPLWKVFYFILLVLRSASKPQLLDCWLTVQLRQMAINKQQYTPSKMWMWYSNGIPNKHSRLVVSIHVLRAEIHFSIYMHFFNFATVMLLRLRLL